MMSFFFKRVYNRLDGFTIATANLLLVEKHWIAALTVLLVLPLVSVIGEYRLGTAK